LQAENACSGHTKGAPTGAPFVLRATQALPASCAMMAGFSSVDTPCVISSPLAMQPIQRVSQTRLRVENVQSHV
jgi:hypothetical protein